MRGNHGMLTWNAGVFHAANDDDLLFVASTQTGFGYFKNFGSTQRQGLELGLTARAGRLSGFALARIDVDDDGTLAAHRL